MAISRTRCSRFGGDVTLDTRVDPAFPRNAIHATFGIDRVTFDAGHANQTKLDVRGYVGLFGQIVLAVRGLSVTTDTPLPDYEHNLLGGAANLRGYEAGYKAGDNLAAASAELRIPITSPLNVGRFGVKAFVDWGTIYAVGRQAFRSGLRARHWRRRVSPPDHRQPLAGRRPLRHRQYALPLRHGSDV